MIFRNEVNRRPRARYLCMAMHFAPAVYLDIHSIRLIECVYRASGDAIVFVCLSLTFINRSQWMVASDHKLARETTLEPWKLPKNVCESDIKWWYSPISMFLENVLTRDRTSEYWWAGFEFFLRQTHKRKCTIGQICIRNDGLGIWVDHKTFHTSACTCQRFPRANGKYWTDLWRSKMQTNQNPS